MQTAELAVDRIAGPVVVRTGFWSGRSTVTVDGQPVARGPGGIFDLPTTDGGTVPARVRSNWLQAYPVLIIDGLRHPMGPATPVWLRVLAVLPMLLVGVGGALGGLFGALGVFANSAIVRREGRDGVKAAAIAGVTIGCALAWLLVATVIFAATQ